MKLNKPKLFVAFAFTVMADPVSSVAYAIEAALAGLDGRLEALTLTMAIVIAIVAVVSAGYHQLVGRFPGGGGGAEALASAFGEGWAFLPVGALIVDFTLTIAVSCAAAASALVAWQGTLADVDVLLALALAALVALGSGAGHRGRQAFSAATLVFIALAVVVVVMSIGAEPASGERVALISDAPLGAALLAVPLGMALATGVEAPSNAIAQLGQLDAADRRRFGRGTIWLMVGIVGILTLGLAVAAVHLNVGLPPGDSTLLAEVARRSTGGGVAFAGFQVASALLLLAAAASSYLAGSGLLRALALHRSVDGRGLLPSRFARTNRWFAPPWGIATLLVISLVLLVLSDGDEQALVDFYAVAVFASFLGALSGAAWLAARDRRGDWLAIDLIGIVAVLFVLIDNVQRVDALVSLGASGAVSLYLYATWVARGRPGGASRVTRG
jgi:amino acid permease-like protein